MTPVPPSSPPGSRPGPGSGASGPPLTSPTPTGFIGRYQVLERIGEGGMGSLYLARDPAIDRLVAIKLLRRGFDTEAVRERFAREARAAGRLRHPNIVTIFDVGEHDGDPFIAMEFLAGETLAELVRQGAGLTLSRRLKLLEELCDGLAYAHRAGLVHRDIKPANLMVDAEGVLKILDFGIVRVSDSGVTQAGVLVGTINYMSPEQVLGTGVDHRSDIFAVGLVAYELLCGTAGVSGHDEGRPAETDPRRGDRAAQVGAPERRSGCRRDSRSRAEEGACGSIPGARADAERSVEGPAARRGGGGEGGESRGRVLGGNRADL